MLNDSYYYNATVRKTVAVFGSLFNNIYIGKVVSGKLKDTTRVPLSYGPREKFLARVFDKDNVGDSDIAVKLPRMSFEITSISFDTAAKLNRNNVRSFEVDGDNGKREVVRQATPYILGLTLSVMSDNTDNGLQVVEQIMPNFSPDYTVSVKDMEGLGTTTDVPITLSGVTLQDDYEGELSSSRRLTIWTLDFTVKVKFVGGQIDKSGVIKSIIVNLSDTDPCDPDSEDISRVGIELTDPENATPDNYTAVTTFGLD